MKGGYGGGPEGALIVEDLGLGSDCGAAVVLPYCGDVEAHFFCSGV